MPTASASRRARVDALAVFVLTFFALDATFVVVASVVNSVAALSPATRLVVRHGFAAMVVATVFRMLTKCPAAIRPRAIVRRWLIGACIGSAAIVLAQLPRWSIVDPELSLSDDPTTIVQWIAIAVAVASFEELVYRRLFDVTFSAAFGSWIGGALQIAFFVASHHPLADPLPTQAVLSRLTFAVVATQLARSKLGLASAIGLHTAVDALIWVGFGTHDFKLDALRPDMLLGVVRMLPADDTGVFAAIAVGIASVWICRRDWWIRPARVFVAFRRRRAMSSPGESG